MLELLEVPEACEKLNLIIIQENSSNWIQLFLRLLRIIFRAESLWITIGSHIPGQLPAPAQVNTVIDKNQTGNTAFSQEAVSTFPKGHLQLVTERHKGRVLFWD